MDLSKTTETDSASDDDVSDDNDDYPNENDARIPSSFSTGTCRNPTCRTSRGHPGSGQRDEGVRYEHDEGAARDLRTDTSEVAESISRQLPIAAFSSGECILGFFENGRKACQSVSAGEPPQHRFRSCCLSTAAGRLPSADGVDGKSTL